MRELLPVAPGAAAAEYLREELPLELDLASVELYWAVPVHISLENGLFNLSPQTPPVRPRLLKDLA